MSVIRKATAIAAGSLFMLGAVAGPTQAAPNVVIPNGLVNVTVGDVTVTDTIDVAAGIAASACGISVIDQVVVLATQVDTTGDKVTVCRTETGQVKISNDKPKK